MKHSSPSTLRNREPIGDVLEKLLPATGKILEIASGTGEHALYFARRFPQLLWQPSDAAVTAIQSIESWQEEADLPNLLPPMLLDASDPDHWPEIEAVTAMMCSNMVHISPWAATEGLLRGAGRVLGEDAPLILYGPYLRDGVETAPSNLAFDADLKRRNPAWGLRSLEEVAALAAQQGFQLAQLFEMPANNITVIFRKTA